MLVAVALQHLVKAMQVVLVLTQVLEVAAHRKKDLQVAVETGLGYQLVDMVAQAHTQPFQVQTSVTLVVVEVDLITEQQG